MRLLLLLLFPSLCSAALVVDPGIVRVNFGATTVQVPVSVTGGDTVTDMAALVEVGSPPLAGPTITAVSYTGSIWQGAAGGFTSFFTGPPPAATVGPNVSLNTAGQTVAGTGTLLTLTVNITGLPAGDYPIRFTNTQGGDSVLARGLTTVSTSFAAGIIRITDDALAAWRETNFPGQSGNAATEATIWGDLADPDKDSLVNLMEYYLGTNPNTATRTNATAAAAGRPSFSFTNVAGQNYATLSYTRRILPAPATAETQASTNLSAWSGSGFVDVGSPVALPGGELQFVVRRLTTPVSAAAPRNFLRLKVTR